MKLEDLTISSSWETVRGITTRLDAKKQRRPRPLGSRYRCSLCGGKGHTKRTHPVSGQQPE